MTAVPFGKKYTKNRDGKGVFNMAPGTEVMVVGYYAPTDNQGDDWVSVVPTVPESYNAEPKTFRRWHLDESYTPVAPPKWQVGKVYRYKNSVNRWYCKFVDLDGYAFMRDDVFGTGGAASFGPEERKDYQEVTN